MTQPLRVMIYDKSCRGRGALPGLSHAWSAGAVLYKMLGRIDRSYGAGYWVDALDWLLEVSADRPLAEIQFWGHGEWGGLWIDEELLTIAALQPGHPVHDRLVALQSRLVPNNALWWFRSCDVFGTQVGHDFARAWTRFFNCRAAGHTHQIMFFQSGLHVLSPGAEPSWPVDEGFVPGLPKARDSSLFAPSTVTCLHNRVPAP
ncbi:MAG TPA: hypothetical protein VIV11_32560 [Kofleriaceae bacterium]